ncbi:HpcH/HpaI aldolase/citrate lyase family protein [Pseudonocardia adelaidensis]|uniref:CoA ester lyase n=1 Tax=Pseudonocardia adelaidensis TaxID=648754 RepID=A0ABP9NTS6_9PSEU
MTRVLRSWLYVPGHRAERVAKALVAGADAVVVDLEDAVPPDRKADARDAIAAAVAAVDTAAGDGPQVWVRVNDPEGPWGAADLDAVTGSGIAGVRLPRSADPDTVRRVAERTGLPLQLVIESAAGLTRAVELAAPHPLVVGIGLGEADLSADLRLVSDAGLDRARGWVVVAARAAGLPSPVQSVWTDVTDLEGLRASCERGRATGFVGRSVVHPRQIPVVHDVYTPTPDEVRRAAAVVRTADDARARGEVAVLDEHGRFVDPAVVAHARVVLDLAVPTGGDR